MAIFNHEIIEKNDTVNFRRNHLSTFTGICIKSFNTISATFYSHYPEILNFFDNRSTNASAESFNAKLKTFRATQRGVVDIEFFLFRVAKIYA